MNAVASVVVLSLFQLHAKNDSLDVSAMINAINTLYDMEGVTPPGNMRQDKAEKLFASLDADGDGMLCEDEFVKGCLEDENLAALLSIALLEPPTEEQMNPEEMQMNLREARATKKK